MTITKETKQNRKKFVKTLYKKANMGVTLYDTKDGMGFYVHPESKNESVLKINNKRVGIFIDYVSNNDWNKKLLIEVDDRLRRNLENNENDKAEIFLKNYAKKMSNEINFIDQVKHLIDDHYKLNSLLNNLGYKGNLDYK